MAYANHDQRNVIFVPNQQLIASGAHIGPVTFVPRPPFGLINPRFGAVVPRFVPIRPPPFPPAGYAVNPEFLARMEVERSVSLLRYMADVGLVPSSEEELKRGTVIDKLKQIVMEWIKRVAYQRRFPRSYVRAAAATILTYGSYGLGVHNSESDIDALCIGPGFATMGEDFFMVLHNMLASRPEISDIHCVKDAKVPLIRFKFDGISVDLPFAQLKVISVPENVNILDPHFLRDIDDTSFKSLSGVRANQSILQLVPNIEMFQSMLRCIKFWAKRRGVYGNLLGFLGGVHLAILTAFICQRYPNTGLTALLSIFFSTFGRWPWPTPVILLDGVMPPETRCLMPIQLPCSPYEYCHSNITRSTLLKIRTEFLRGHALTKDYLKPEFDWNSLFEPYPYIKKYSRFVKVYLSASNGDELGDWAGWVKSRFRSLIVKLEEVYNFCDPNPTEYVDSDIPQPNVVFYWGLQAGGGGSEQGEIEYVEEDFKKNLTNGYVGPVGKMELSLVRGSQLPKSFHLDGGRREGMIKASWRFWEPVHQVGIPVYSRHVPHYLVGYLATNNGDWDGHAPPPEEYNVAVG